jgi:cytochrome bd-I ubiquinol oxidase subunit X
MWYFAWILGLGLALAFGIINVMWLEASFSLGELEEETVGKRFQPGAKVKTRRDVPE